MSFRGLTTKTSLNLGATRIIVGWRSAEARRSTDGSHERRRESWRGWASDNEPPDRGSAREKDPARARVRCRQCRVSAAGRKPGVVRDRTRSVPERDRGAQAPPDVQVRAGG